MRFEEGSQAEMWVTVITAGERDDPNTPSNAVRYERSVKDRAQAP